MKQIGFYKMFSIRAVICYLLSLVLAAVCVLRVLYLNITIKENYANSPINSVSFNYGNTRGDILDCYGFPLTNENKEYLAIITPGINAVKRLTSFYNLPDRKNITSLLKNNKPILFSAPTLINVDGIYGFEYTNRYNNNTLAKHLIGYLDYSNNGVYGIEKAYNNILYSKDVFTVSLPCDAKGQALNNTKIELYGKKNNNSVFLTIDKRIQKVVEEKANDLTSGAVIVCESSSGKIKAMFSNPGFDQNNIANSLNQKNSPLINKALHNYNVGSVFKPCVAVAAIEEGLENFVYNCKGSCNIDGYTFNCHNKNGHGKLDLTNAIAFSCNTYFYNLAQKIDNNVLYNTAVKLGFLSEINLGGIKSECGKINSLKELNSSKRLVANFSIGQGGTLLSPVNMLNLYNAIANDGSYIKPYCVEKTVSNNKTKEFASNRVEVFSKKTATIIKKALLKVVTDGTGKKVKSEKIELAGKTATAETGYYIDNKKVVSSWFCGFFPYNKPKYTVVVFSENINTPSIDTATVFKNIAEELENLGLNS